MMESFTDYLNFYKNQVTHQILPFWCKSLDETNGGIFTCFNNEGTELISKDKYTWSQGRFVWLWSRLYEMCSNGMIEGDAKSYLRQAEKTVEFLKKHAFLENGHCAFILTETGLKKELSPGEGYDSSIYADCFVVLGLTEYARVKRDRATLEFALKLLDGISERIEQGSIRSEPYSIPAGYASHGISMIMLNVTQEMTLVLEELGHVRGPELKRNSIRYMQTIMEHFCCEDYTIAEMITEDTRLMETVLARHINPGHTIECMWFVMKSAEHAGRQDYIEKAIRVIKKAFELGWDQECGGIFRYVDREGGRPRGKQTGDGFEQLIKDTYSTKIWWAHSEALYSTLYAYHLSGDSEMQALYDKVYNYTFSVFPNPDKNVGEWIQIRNREGTPIDTLVALPVKDPYHILRNLLLMIELLSNPSTKT